MLLSTRRATKKERLLYEEYNFSKMKEVPNPLKGKKIGVGINLSTTIIDYFKRLSEETGIPCQKLKKPQIFTSKLGMAFHYFLNEYRISYRLSHRWAVRNRQWFCRARN